MNNTNRKYLVDGVATVRLPKVMKYYDSTGNELIPVRHGHWIYRKYTPFEPLGYDCSECGKGSCSFTYYCPNCGAKMDGVLYSFSNGVPNKFTERPLWCELEGEEDETD